MRECASRAAASIASCFSLFTSSRTCFFVTRHTHGHSHSRSSQREQSVQNKAPLFYTERTTTTH